MAHIKTKFPQLYGVTKKEALLSKLKAMQKSHEQTGFDSDYLDRSSLEELEFMLEFSREYYDGTKGAPESKRQANSRRYKAKQSDAMSRADYFPIPKIDDMDPEKHLLLKESLIIKPPHIPLKRCSVCKMEREVWDFYPSRNGLRSNCKYCKT